MNSTVLTYDLGLNTKISLSHQPTGIGHIKAMCKVMVFSLQRSPYVLSMEGLIPHSSKALAQTQQSSNIVHHLYVARTLICVFALEQNPQKIKFP